MWDAPYHSISDSLYGTKSKEFVNQMQPKSSQHDKG